MSHKKLIYKQYEKDGSYRIEIAEFLKDACAFYDEYGTPFDDDVQVPISRKIIDIVIEILRDEPT